MFKNQIIHFSLSLSYDQYFKVYQGIAKNISVVADDGRRIMFSAGKIQPFLTKQGIHGHFQLELTAENKFVSLQRLK
ncbi:MAG: DUF2835 domain-containing protein [Methylococcaceae bacterium]|nr:DUF2835 domain-containing protein [Methylococcaceae bacterium]